MSTFPHEGQSAPRGGLGHMLRSVASPPRGVWLCVLLPWLYALHLRNQLIAHTAAAAAGGMEPYYEKHGGALRYVRSPSARPGYGLGCLKDLEHGAADAEGGWGARCRAPGNVEVLVALPYKVSMPDKLAEALCSNLRAMECANPGFNLRLGLTSKVPTADDAGGRGRIAMIRNMVIGEFLRPEHAFVFWLDADVVRLPADLIARLHAANPTGVSAPAVVVEGSNTTAWHRAYCHRNDCAAVWQQQRPAGARGGTDAPQSTRGTGAPPRFYDTAAFFEAGEDVSLANKPARGHPQFGAVRAWPPFAGRTGDRVVDMESVGTVYLVPAEVSECVRSLETLKRRPRLGRTQHDTTPPSPLQIYHCRTCAPGVKFEHFSTTFTEHFPIVHAAKHYFGMRVIMVPELVAEHAELTRYGEVWHTTGSNEQWISWLEPYLGKQLSDPAVSRQSYTGPCTRTRKRCAPSTPSLPPPPASCVCLPGMCTAPAIAAGPR